MKKIFPLLFLAPLCLASCGEASYAGKYQFMLGRAGEDQTRFGLEFELKDDAYVIPEENKELYTPDELKMMEKAKQVKINVDLGSALAELFKELHIDGGFEGYYLLLDEKDPKYGYKMALGTDIPISEIDIPLDAGLIRNVLVSYVDGSSVTLQMPVSLVDLQHQLCWYSGTYIDFDPYIKTKIHDREDLMYYLPEILSSLKIYSLEDYSPLPGKEGDARFGSHPEFVMNEDGSIVKDEITEMNEKYAGLFSNTFVYSIEEDEITHEKITGDKIGSIYKDLYKGNIIYNFFPLNGYTVPADGLINGVRVLVDDAFTANKPIDIDMQIYCAVEGEDDINWIKSNGEMIDIEDIMTEGFEFRDFHDIKVQLKKE